MPSSSRCIPGESVSYAVYMFANIVSPPYGGTSRASSIVAIGGRSRYDGVAVPDPTEVHRLVRELRDRDDLGVAVEALDERVLHRLADAVREGEELVGPEDLVAEEDDEVVQPRASDLGDDRVVELGREVDPGDLGAECARDGLDRDGGEVR